MNKIVLIKNSDGLRPASERDADLLSAFANGSAVTAKLTTKHSRSLAMHRMYWALLNLAVHYWEPINTITFEHEKVFCEGLMKFLNDNGHETGGVAYLLDAYMKELTFNRQVWVPLIERSAEGLHNWLKKQTGFYDVVLTPTGVTKNLKSISFESMTHEQWKLFYKDAFNVLWDFILSQCFESEEEAQNAVDQMLTMGN
jgi:hypothetical protein